MSGVIELKESDNQKAITVEKGQQIDLVLQMNPSTGFFWQAVDSSAGTMDRVQHDAAPDGKPPRPGAPVNVRFRFTALNDGNFTLNYARPWAELTPPAKWFSVEIKVKN